MDILGMSMGGKTYELVFVTLDVRDIHVVGGGGDILLQTGKWDETAGIIG